jgi:pimeloyl-ACP methyl ester carboxylesterase
VQAADHFPRGLLNRTRDYAAEPGALTAILNWYRAFIRGGGLRQQLHAGFPTIETPTLLLWGEADPFLAKSTTLGTDTYVRDLTTVYLPGVSHWLQQDAPEICNRIIRDYLCSQNL